MMCKGVWRVGWGGWGCVMCKGVWRGGVGRVGMCDV